MKLRYCEGCSWFGPEAELLEGNMCPKCNSEDVFPLRIFLCDCGNTDEQAAFFGDAEVDPHPITDLGLTPKCPYQCGSTSATEVTSSLWPDGQDLIKTILEERRFATLPEESEWE